MSARLLATLAAALMLATAAPAQKAEPEKKPKAGAEAIIDTLHKQEVQLGEMNLNDIPLTEMLIGLSKRYDVTFVVMEEQFRQRGSPTSAIGNRPSRPSARRG